MGEIKGKDGGIERKRERIMISERIGGEKEGEERMWYFHKINIMILVVLSFIIQWMFILHYIMFPLSTSTSIGC